MKFRELKKILARFGISWDNRRGKGSHGVFVGLTHVTRLRQVYPVPSKQQKQIDVAYINPLRRKFELTAEDGVDDEAFFGSRR